MGHKKRESRFPPKAESRAPKRRSDRKSRNIARLQRILGRDGGTVAGFKPRLTQEDAEEICCLPEEVVRRLVNAVAGAVRDARKTGRDEVLYRDVSMHSRWLEG